ncbi:MAG: nitronate monooxygenase, partial [Lachnospiraceae bacterium]|nr:nitronate monooxygenase [Lachnospiraceae bacterium]
MIKSAVCELLGIEYPVFQGGMAWISDGKLAAAVSAGGGLGIIAAGNAPGEYVREQIRIAKSLTDKPIGVNIMLLSPFADEVAKVVIEEKADVVTTGAGNPSKYIKEWLAAGIKVIPVVASVAMAKLMTRLGASALIAEGGESGGHIGELTTMVLVPQIVDATTLPVIAAGGIGNGRGVAAAFMLGASAVQMGTRFLSAYECSIHPNYKEKILHASDLCTMVTGKRLGHPVRSLRTPFARDYFKAEYSDISDEDLEKLGMGALKMAVIDGDNEKGCFLAG